MPRSAKTKRLNYRRTKSGPSHRFYNSSGANGWRGKHGIRARHLQRFPFCVECINEGKQLSECIPERAIVDHIRPHKGRWHLFSDMTNLQTLCQAHHNAKTIRQEGWGDGGYGTAN